MDLMISDYFVSVTCIICNLRGYKREMATGRSNKLVGQTGEYLVAAELSRRGHIATTFTGNVPHYDIIASDEAEE